MKTNESRLNYSFKRHAEKGSKDKMVAKETDLNR